MKKKIFALVSLFVVLGCLYVGLYQTSQSSQAEAITTPPPGESISYDMGFPYWDAGVGSFEGSGTFVLGVNDVLESVELTVLDKNNNVVGSCTCTTKNVKGKLFWTGGIDYAPASGDKYWVIVTLGYWDPNNIVLIEAANDPVLIVIP